MARRFGGKYSPDGDADADGPAPAAGSDMTPRVNPVGARANLLFVPPILLLFTTLTDGPVPMTLGLAGAGALTLGAWLLRGGLEAEAAYHTRKIARRPALPRKILAACLAGVGAALGVMAHDGAVTILGPLLYAVAAGALHVAAFGTDPLRNKGMEGVDQFQTDRVARVVDKAETHLATMRAAIERTGDRQAEARVERFQSSVRNMLRTVENDPRDLTAARRYLGVYLKGATDATLKFAEVYARSRDKAARDDYLTLLSDLEENFSAKTRTLLEDSSTDLEVEISVLRDRLKREGIHLNRD
ncbi:5-bromo-4-chloroindolyl phosphate hydrolysis family protein [Roseovarius sp. SCSIO 43702]|uniref:5-bromo-4-chloroindolyl phosphate hydrolysis family protein n=1 Tax=Roseovarius sp. SCSIO 43702 TaxID=2823043 RepID=UPI001C73DA89|nr:5-bromo-4-chloroindolyl phosphate hydrolysis family protein [Roseovarius sp. SCSIO 43702]QYX56292.1 5-bromo-4-chloroindolyl phosphate hydrolysis family protein [Roseovarius sp. SCSIO 43702]